MRFTDHGVGCRIRTAVVPVEATGVLSNIESTTSVLHRSIYGYTVEWRSEACLLLVTWYCAHADDIAIPHQWSFAVRASTDPARLPTLRRSILRNRLVTCCIIPAVAPSREPLEPMSWRDPVEPRRDPSLLGLTLAPPLAYRLGSVRSPGTVADRAAIDG